MPRNTIASAATRKFAVVGTAIASSAFASLAAYADAPTLALTLNSSTWTDRTAEGDASTGFVYSNLLEGAEGRLDYRVEVLPSGQSVLGFSFDVVNTTGATQLYTLTSAIAVAGMPNGCLLGASIGGSVSDANFDGTATLTSAFGNPLFWGGIDFGGPSQQQLATLINAPFTISAPFIGGTASVGPASIGLPGPSAPGSGFAGGFQSIALRFALTAGDRASFSGVFVLQPVPAPSALALLTASALIAKRRRR
ncbi:MAG: hypothetical protein QM516_02510 [Limnohabitans sp.]|jgi:hypothetical protein|nr:hypothetical protein [Limnohabitans sp.]